jgi:hypothetical protein
MSANTLCVCFVLSYILLSIWRNGFLIAVSQKLFPIQVNKLGTLAIQRQISVMLPHDWHRGMLSVPVRTLTNKSENNYTEPPPHSSNKIHAIFNSHLKALYCVCLTSGNCYEQHFCYLNQLRGNFFKGRFLLHLLS